MPDPSTRLSVDNLAAVGFDTLGPLRRFIIEEYSAQPDMSNPFKHASELFLTRRFTEAYEVIDTLVSPPKHESDSYDQHDSDEPPQAPVANLKTDTRRIKIWVLYISILNAIVDLGEHEGAQKLGEARYQEIARQVRSGGVWDKVKRDGYHGELSAVDPEVAFNLAMLQLGQAPSQIDNQTRVRKYLTGAPLPTFVHRTPSDKDASLPPNVQEESTPSQSAKYLKSYLDVIELFVLHILPRNEEWAYARSYIDSCDFLDNERKVSFILTLNQLTEEAAAERKATKDRFAAEKARAAKAAREEAEKKREEKQKAKESDKTPSAPRPTTTKKPDKPQGHGQSTSATLAHRASTLISKLEGLVRSMATSLGGNPAMLLRLLLSAVAIIMVFGKGDARERAKRILAKGWEKVKETVGMGVKISYV